MPANSPLIEHYLPIDEISIESIRERAAASALPPINWLHVWWSRKPLTTSRAAVAASLMSDDASRADLLVTLGIPETLLAEHAAILEARAKGVRSANGYSQNARSLTTRHRRTKPYCEETDILPPCWM